MKRFLTVPIVALQLAHSSAAQATPSTLVKTFAVCLGRFEAASAPRPQRDAMRDLMEAATPAALDWGMPEAHIREARSRARIVQTRHHANMALSPEPRMRETARRAAEAAIAECQALLPVDSDPIPLPAGYGSR